jgi:hypothetical protein
MNTRTYGLQTETRQYLRRLYSYGRELVGDDIYDIDDFIKGLKQLNLWGNTVCWPMKSIHNIGMGSTVLSLGGGGVFNGTMVNSPTWGSTGVSRGANAYVNIFPSQSVLRCSTILACGMTTSASDNQRIFACEDGTAGGQYFQLTFNAGISEAYIGISRNNVSTSATKMSTTGRNSLFNLFGGSLGDSSQFNHLNGINGTVQTGLASRSYSRLINFFRLLAITTSNNGGFSGTISFAMVNLTPISTTAFTDLYKIYKVTIGKNLGLP